MKDLIIISVMYLTCSIANGQSYYVDFTKSNSIDNIEINIDTAYASKGIFVEKLFRSTDIDKNLFNQNSFILLGDFIQRDNVILLNYLEYNYYWIPFDPDVPFRSLNYIVEDNNTIGKLYFDDPTLHERKVSPGDIWYFCSCNGDRTAPGGCLSTLSGNIAECVSDGCTGYCMGYVLESYEPVIAGGGILIQVAKSKNILYHNFGTGKINKPYPFGSDK